MKDAFCALNKNFQPDAPDRQANVLLNLGEQSVREEHVGCILHFGNHNDINVPAGGFHNFNYVSIEKLCVNPIRAEGANFAVKVESGECFNQRLARSNFLRRSAAIFQIKDDFIRLAGRGLRHHLERMRGTGKLTATNRMPSCCGSGIGSPSLRLLGNGVTVLPGT